MALVFDQLYTTYKEIEAEHLKYMLIFFQVSGYCGIWL